MQSRGQTAIRAAPEVACVSLFTCLEQVVVDQDVLEGESSRGRRGMRKIDSEIQKEAGLFRSACAPAPTLSLVFFFLAFNFWCAVAGVSFFSRRHTAGEKVEIHAWFPVLTAKRGMQPSLSRWRVPVCVCVYCFASFVLPLQAFAQAVHCLGGIRVTLP